MNTVRILICATFALLIAALVHSYSTRTANPREPKEPREKSISELREELERVKLENMLKRERAASTPLAYDQMNGQYAAPYTNPNTPNPNIGANPNNIVPVPTAPPADFVNPLASSNTPALPAAATPAPDPATKAALDKITALESENAKLKEQQVKQENENNMLQEEAGVIQSELRSQNQPEEARAAVIAQALVMARVKIYDPESGIIVLDLVRAQNLTTGQVLGIRRGTAGGIIGRIKLGNIDSSELGYADPIAESFFGGPVDIKVGDEIIVIP